MIVVYVPYPIIRLYGCDRPLDLLYMIHMHSPFPCLSSRLQHLSTGKALKIAIPLNFALAFAFAFVFAIAFAFAVISPFVSIRSAFAQLLLSLLLYLWVQA